jgi:two-component system cell cycle sensor histidine kinase/response regulator CckA
MAKARVMIVEDEAIIASTIAGTLKKLGYELVEIAASGEAAVAVALQKKPDLILMDIHLNGEMDGIAAAGRIQSSSDIPVVYLTGYSQELMFQQAKVTAPYGYLVKPVNERELAMTLEIALYRHSLDRRLRESEENFRLSLDESPLGVRISTAAGETLYANRVLLGFYGFASIEELNRTPLRERYTPKSYGEFKKRSKTRKRDGSGPNEYEVSIVRKDGEVRSLQVFRKAILWNGDNQIQALYRDISESKHWLETFKKFEKTIRGQKMILDQQSSSVEELIKRLTRSREELGASYRELKTKKDDLVRSEKLAFTGRMASGIAHEIRNPLTNVILSLRQLKKSEKIKPEVLKYAEIMERNTNRIEYLISELLNCARPVKLSIQPCDIHLLIRDILNVHKVRLKTQKITVVQNLAAHPAILAFDKEQLGRVFLNLIANAIEAMDSGGKLTIATKNEKKKFVCRIQDNGRGIPKKNLMNVFDPFFSTKKGGTGLGLSTCQNIVTSHGGLIEVESAWKKGSVFSVSLPLEAKPSERKEKKKSRS